jgi:hypothetical protein
VSCESAFLLKSSTAITGEGEIGLIHLKGSKDAAVEAM